MTMKLNKVFIFCNRITRGPIFPAVMVFTLSFLIAGVLFDMSSAKDGGVECNNYSTQDERSLCTKLNGIFLVLTIGVPVMGSIVTYMVAKRKEATEEDNDSIESLENQNG